METTWTQAVADGNRFASFEDPITGYMIMTSDFDKVYGDACRELFDGEECLMRVETFFEQNPIVQTTWMLRDDDAREDLYDIARDMNLIPAVDEIRQGETHEQKQRRDYRETQIALSKETFYVKPRTALTLTKSYEEQMARLDTVQQALQAPVQSSKKRKRLQREERGLLHALA